MGLESVTYANDLVQANPTGGDVKSQGDDHLRNIKAALKNTIPGFLGAVAIAGPESGVANVYVVTPVTPLQSYTQNSILVLQPGNTNTGAATVNVSALGALPLQSCVGAPLAANDLIAGDYYVFVCTGTAFNLVGVTKNYADQLAFSSVVPTQPGGATQRSFNTVNGVATWSIPRAPMTRIFGYRNF
ncbi:MAG TPA: hypothetical protein VIF60_24365 [Burkholderiaceae bacterium]|jgi:hypothetical protein